MENIIMKRYFVPILVALFITGNLSAQQNHSQSWGELRYAHKSGNIRTGPSIDAELRENISISRKRVD